VAPFQTILTTHMIQFCDENSTNWISLSLNFSLTPSLQSQFYILTPGAKLSVHGLG